MLDGQATDVLEGSSLSFQSAYIDIYSNCWGPKDDGKTFGKPGKLAQEALMQGALKVMFNKSWAKKSIRPLMKLKIVMTGRDDA